MYGREEEETGEQERRRNRGERERREKEQKGRTRLLSFCVDGCLCFLFVFRFPKLRKLKKTRCLWVLISKHMSALRTGGLLSRSRATSHQLCSYVNDPNLYIAH